MQSDGGPGRRRFSFDQAAAIMREYNTGSTTVRDLAERHNIHWSVMQSLVSGRTYRDIWTMVQREGFQSIVDWEDPPPRTNPGPANTPGRVLEDLIALLKAHPGRWAWVKTTVNRPNLSWWHRRGLDAEMRKIEDGWRVYARWPVENSPT